ncbi:MAG: NAD(P)H:quinone oxidoreductase [Candidatus Ratteibacteria bacterium]|nr:NAD(P)H:quinone oxidoreductase [Candidatus Ratteibacteria bacterium]
MNPRIMVLYYSMYGNNYLMAKAVCEGIKIEGGEAVLRTVPELVPQDIINKDERMKKAKQMQKDVQLVKLSELENIDGIILGSPTRFGNMCAQLRNFLDQTGGVWMKGLLIDKPAGVFCCTGTMHGAQETTLISMMFTLLHHGCMVLGVPYSVKEIIETKNGGTPYGPTAVVGPSADKPPTEIDLKIAQELGKRITRIAKEMNKS